MKRRRMKMMMMRKMMNLLSCLEGGNVMSSITLMYVYPSFFFPIPSYLNPLYLRTDEERRRRRRRRRRRKGQKREHEADQ